MTPEPPTSRNPTSSMNSITVKPAVTAGASVSSQPICEHACLQEIQGWRDLGDLAEARRIAAGFLDRQDSHAICKQAMELAMFCDDLPAATRHALHIYRHHPWNSAGAKLLPVVLALGGFVEEAYARTKENCRNDPDPLAGYNIACRAWAVGRHEEAFRAALRCFSSCRDTEALRKMLLDTELRELWAYAAEREVTVADAIRWAHCPLEWVVRLNTPIFPPREVDFADLPDMPQEFLPILWQRTANTKVVDSAKAFADPELFQRFLTWQAQTCLPSFRGLVAWVSRLRRRYDEILPSMVQFCVDRGHLGTGRYLLRQFLTRNPEVTPDSIPAIDGLEYFTSEWQRLWQFDREGTRFLISRRQHFEPLETFLDRFCALPLELRSSGLGWMVFGSELRSGQRIAEAYEAFRRALEFWPRDYAVHHNILLCLCGLGRWNEAKVITDHPEFLAAAPELAEFARRAVARQSAPIQPPDPYGESPFPTPCFGFPHRREDAHFLRWFRKNQKPCSIESSK